MQPVQSYGIRLHLRGSRQMTSEAADRSILQSVKDMQETEYVVHINTLKGKGYAPAEQNKEVWLLLADSI